MIPTLRRLFFSVQYRLAWSLGIFLFAGIMLYISTLYTLERQRQTQQALYELQTLHQQIGQLQNQYWTVQQQLPADDKALKKILDDFDYSHRQVKLSIDQLDAWYGHSNQTLLLFKELQQQAKKLAQESEAVAKLWVSRGSLEKGARYDAQLALNTLVSQNPAIFEQRQYQLRAAEQSYWSTRQAEQLDYWKRTAQEISTLLKASTAPDANEQLYRWERYAKSFSQATALEEQLDLSNTSGTGARWMELLVNTRQQTEALQVNTHQAQTNFKTRLSTITGIGMGLMLLIFAQLAFFIWKDIIKPLQALRANMEEVFDQVSPSMLIDKGVSNIEQRRMDIVAAQTMDNEIAQVKALFNLVSEEFEERSIALESQQDNTEAERRELTRFAEYFRTLNALGQEIATNFSILNIIQRAVNPMQDLLQASSFGIGVYNPRHNHLEFFTHATTQAAPYEYSLSLENEEHSLEAHCFLQRHDLLLPDLREQALPYPLGLMQVNGQATNPPQSLMMLPLMSHGKPVGVITVQSTEPNLYQPLHLDLLRNLGNYAVIALENAKVYNQIQQQKEQIIDSISYAQRIQEAILPPIHQLQHVVGDAFVLFKPKDIVSGDFYWFAKTDPKPIYEEVLTEKGARRVLKEIINEKIVIAAIDCTGHGVPGAFMSAIGNDLLNNIVIHEGIVEPSQILYRLHQEIRIALKQNETNNQDGMDAAICVIDLEEEEMLYAGAYNPLLYIQNKEIRIIQGDNNPVGGWHIKGNERKFSTHTIPLDKPTVFYLLTDGFQDQIGSRDEKKFTTKRLHQLLLNIHTLRMDEQRHVLDDVMNDWMGEIEQVDDMLVLGFKVKR